jgi:UDP-N-acetylmuramate--alanine ligase
MTGTKRRCETIGKTKNGALLIDDYGHHPLEISTTINAIKGSFPDKQIIVVFQPHTYSRTKALLGDFAKAFEKADRLLLLPIFKSMRDTESDVISSQEYLAPFKEKSEVIYQDKASDMVEYISKNYDSEEYLIVTMGAGDVYKIGYQLNYV